MHPHTDDNTLSVPIPASADNDLVWLVLIGIGAALLVSWRAILGIG